MQPNDEDNDNPKDVDELLSKELLELSVNDRNEILEEIHGVGCLAPTETPELIEQALSRLERELDTEIPVALKRAYEMSQTFDKTYVNDVDFRLRILRCELFDVSKAALRMCNFLELVFELFGKQALQRPIMLDDFSKEELRKLREGYYQLLPFRDRAGRKIITIIPGGGMESLDPVTKAKIALYTSWAAGCNDAETQRKGVVVLVWFDKSIKTTPRPSTQRYKDHEVASVRASAIHCCTPDSPFYIIRRSIMTMRIASHNRSKLKVHLGESVENRYALQTYGIPADQIPLTWSGTIKLQYHKQWVRNRQAIEKRELEQSISGLPLSTFAELNRTTMIDIPKTNDVLFRQGTSTTSHSGNVAFRLMIESRLQELEYIQQQEAQRKESQQGKSTTKSTKIKTRKVCMDVIEKIRDSRKGRFLVWNGSGWWDELQDLEQIYLKVEYIVREYRLNVKRKKKALENAKKAEEERLRVRSLSRLNSDAVKSQSSRAISKPHSAEVEAEESKLKPNFEDQTRRTVHLSSVTSMFLDNQQHDMMACLTGAKRPRHHQGSTTFENEMAPSLGEAECFGMKFMEFQSPKPLELV